MARIHGQFRSDGLFPTGLEVPGCWMRDRATVSFKHVGPLKKIKVSGSFLPNTEDLHSKYAKKPLAMEVRLGNTSMECSIEQAGAFEFCLSDFVDGVPDDLLQLSLILKGVKFSNFLALLGRIFEHSFWLPKGIRSWLQPFRRQFNNRQLLVRSIEVNEELLIDLDRPHAAFNSEYLFRHSKIGLNIIGWFQGFLGVGESARACVHAARAVGLEVDTVPLNLHLEGGQSETLWPEPFATAGEQLVTVAHVDAPQSFDLRKRHPREMASDIYRIGYWAWELPEFPDAWIQYASAFDEIWCPSEFCRQAMSAKLPVPVTVMPHAIEVPEVKGDIETWRKRFKLPADTFLFLFSYDLNSYSPRKNPEAVVEAYRKAFVTCDKVGSANVGLVLKMHGRGYSKEERVQLEELKSELPNLFFVDEALSREDLTGLQMACDSFVSLHRAEGFGLAVAEMMALGKPVITTDWSATSEFVDETMGCPVAYQLVELESNVGPYTKGQVWADADTEDAARWMQKIACDESFRTRIALEGQNHIKTHFSPEAIGKRYQNRLKAIALFQQNSL